MSIEKLKMILLRSYTHTQVLDLSRNSLSDLPQNLFKMNADLRIVDISNNYLRSLPDGLFGGSGLEA